MKKRIERNNKRRTLTNAEKRRRNQKRDAVKLMLKWNIPLRRAYQVIKNEIKLFDVVNKK